MVGCKKKKKSVELSYGRVSMVSYIYAECMRIVCSMFECEEWKMRGNPKLWTDRGRW